MTAFCSRIKLSPLTINWLFKGLALLLLAVLAVNPMNVSAAQDATARKELESLQARIQEVRQALKSNRQARIEAVAVLEDLEKSISRSAASAKQTDAEIRREQARLKQARVDKRTRESLSRRSTEATCLAGSQRLYHRPSGVLETAIESRGSGFGQSSAHLL